MPIKKTIKIKASPKAKPKPQPKVSRYIEAIGRRKTAVARVRLYSENPGDFLINGKTLEKYFPILELQQRIKDPFVKVGQIDKFSVLAKVSGGGFNAQAEALRHGIARALVKIDSECRKVLKKTGLLTRDSRMRERKKPGLKRARRAPQWRKR